MSLLYSSYTLLTSGALMSGLPPFWLYTRLSGRYRNGLGERLGFIAPSKLRWAQGSPRIWIQAVSLGEVRAAVPIIRALRRYLPECSVFLSTTTEHGLGMARDLLKGEVSSFYAPLDNLFPVRMALFRVKPDVMVFLETEIWPTWIWEAHRMGIKTALLNGRVSVRSLGSYLRFRPFFKEVLKRVHLFSMIGQDDALRIKAMGADPAKVVVKGNAKYDHLVDQVDPAMEKKMREILDLDKSSPVIIAGSTRQGEEIPVLEAYGKILVSFPHTILIIVPRHIERSAEIKREVKKRGYGCRLRSELGHGKKRQASVVIVDTFGELFNLYSIGSVVFCGASLVPLGGQNPLEPAAWGKAVIYGPSMDDFRDAKDLLEKKQASVEVSGPEMLADKVIELFNDPPAMRAYGDRALAAVMENQKAGERHAEGILKLISSEAPP